MTAVPSWFDSNISDQYIKGLNNMSQSLKNRLRIIIDFVENKTQIYKYKDLLNDTQKDIEDLKELPCEFTLLVNDPSLSIKRGYLTYKPQIWELIQNFNNQWEFFTKDHLNPIPIKPNINESYNSGLIQTSLKSKGLLWDKSMKDMRLLYLKDFYNYLPN